MTEIVINKDIETGDNAKPLSDLEQGTIYVYHRVGTYMIVSDQEGKKYNLSLDGGNKGRIFKLISEDTQGFIRIAKKATINIEWE